MQRITFVRVGMIERLFHDRKGKIKARWIQGWSENGNTYPWVPRTEACNYARAKGARARFVDKLPEYPLIGGGTTTDYLEHLKDQRTFACNNQTIKMLDKKIATEESWRNLRPST